MKKKQTYYVTITFLNNYSGAQSPSISIIPFAWKTSIPRAKKLRSSRQSMLWHRSPSYLNRHKLCSPANFSIDWHGNLYTFWWDNMANVETIDVSFDNMTLHMWMHIIVVEDNMVCVCDLFITIVVWRHRWC